MRGRLVVIGAGPMGLYAALEGVRRGLDVTVLEKDEVGSAVLAWGPTRFFSPLEMNAPPAVRETLGDSMPAPEALLTAPEMVDRVLRPLAASRPLSGRVLTGHCVAGVARSGMTRMDYAGHPIRSERPFRILTEAAGEERAFDAEFVLDASGVTGQPCWMGEGGLPAAGERGLGKRIVRDLGMLDRLLPGWTAKRILVVGHGHSAATAVLRLTDLARRDPAARVTWAVRTGNLRPCAEVANDPLTERQRVASAANDLAQNPPETFTVLRRTTVERLRPEGTTISVRFKGGRTEDFDEIVSLTGYRPDLSILSELALETSPVTEGAAGLARALSGVTDCLSVPRVSRRDLGSGEPGFWMIGSKSYGRSRNFLIRTGLEQLDAIFAALAGSAGV